MTSIEIVLRLSYCERKDFERLIEEADEIAPMIFGFSKSLSSNT